MSQISVRLASHGGHFDFEWQVVTMDGVTSNTVARRMRFDACKERSIVPCDLPEKQLNSVTLHL